MSFEKISDVFNNEGVYEDGEKEKNYVKDTIEKSGRGTYRVQESRGDLRVSFLGNKTIDEVKEDMLSEVDEEEQEEIKSIWNEFNDESMEGVLIENEYCKIFYENDESFLLEVKK